MVEITKEFENTLLKRKEIVADIQTQGATITRQEAKQQLAKKLGVAEELIIIEGITSHFGSRTATITAFVYEDSNALKKVTLKHIVKRNQQPQQAEEQEA